MANRKTAEMMDFAKVIGSNIKFLRLNREVHASENSSTCTWSNIPAAGKV